MSSDSEIRKISSDKHDPNGVNPRASLTSQSEISSFDKDIRLSAKEVSSDEPDHKKFKRDKLSVKEDSDNVLASAHEVNNDEPDHKNFKKDALIINDEDDSSRAKDYSSSDGESSSSSPSSSSNSDDDSDDNNDDDNANDEAASGSSWESVREANVEMRDTKCPVGKNSLPSKASGGVDEIQLRDGSRPLDLLDEVRDDDSSEGEESIVDGESESYSSDDVPLQEIDELLEESLGNKEKEGKGTRDPRAIKPKLINKIVLVDKPVNYFEVLPAGWIDITHDCGMPLYLHKETRVVSFSRPYWLGPASARRHEVPISAIPCLQVIREKEAAEKRKTTQNPDNTHIASQDSPPKAVSATTTTNVVNEELKSTSTSSATSTCPINHQDMEKKENLAPLPKGPLAEALKAQSHLPIDFTPPDKLSLENQPSSVMSEIRVNEGHSLNANQLTDYCNKRFKFKTIKVMKFAGCIEKRVYEREARRKMRPQLPEGSKLIALSTVDNNSNLSGFRKNWVINPKGKSTLCILHEYVQHALKHQPKYSFGETDNAAMPYSATISIAGMIYSTGYGSSKKVAKHEAAEKALAILLPDFAKKFPKNSKDMANSDFSIFDSIAIEDLRIPDLCDKTSEYLPSSILLCCLGRNFGLGTNNIVSKLIVKENQKNEYTMTVGRHTVVVPCRNKKDGKQRASQAILQKLHPYINNWGSLLRLYGSESNKKIKDLKMEEQQVTFLQSKAEMDRPNLLLIKKLRDEMLKLHKLRSDVQPIGTFNPAESSSLPSSHGSDLNNVDL